MTISEISRKCGLSDKENEIFLDYISNKFAECKETSDLNCDFLSRWEAVCSFATVGSASEAINKFICSKRPVAFEEPDSIRIEMYNSFAGKIPVIYLPNKNDFETLVTNSVYKGIRPENLSETGASFAFGKTNAFIMLSAKPYSNVPASEIGIDEKEWAEKSMIIRREHECTHYYTRQVYGISRNCLHDEIMADFFGLYEAFGSYKAEYFQRFMGIVGSSGGRLKFYTEGLPENVHNAVAETAVSASAYLENWSVSDEFRNMTRESRLSTLCKIGLEGMCR